MPDPVQNQGPTAAQGLVAGLGNPAPLPPAGKNTDPGDAPDMQGPTMSATAPATQIQQVPVPFVPPHVSRLAGIGHIASSLLGNQYQYSVDPKTGQQVQTPIPNKPGSLFRQMVVGALLGGAAAEGAGDPTAGFFKGGAAGAQNTMQQDQLRRQQAQEQFRNKVLANRENRENAESDERVKASQAQTALHNVQKLHENQLIQDTDLEMHEKTADIGKAKVQAYIKSGVNPTFRDQSETQMNELQKNNPAYKDLDWEPTGVAFTKDANGNVSHELTYSGYTKKNPVTIEQGVVDALEKQGMKRYDPAGFAAMQRKAKTGEPMDAQDYATVNMQAQGYYNTQLGNQKEKMQTDEYQSQIHKNNIEANKYQAEIDEIKQGKNKNDVYAKAMARFQKAGSLDSPDLTDEDREAIAEGSKPFLDEAVKMYDTSRKYAADNPGDKDAQTAVHDAYAAAKRLQDLHQSALGLLKKVPLPQGDGKPLVDKEVIKQFIQEAGGDITKAQEIAKKNGWIIPAGATPAATGPNNPVPGADAANAVVNSLAGSGILQKGQTPPTSVPGAGLLNKILQ